VVLGVNLNNASGLLVEYDIAINGPDSQLEALRAGKMKPHGSWWAYRSLRSATAVLRSLDGDPVRDEADPVVLADALPRISRLQTVKCSPQDDARSSRTVNMRANCPPKFLQRELEILDPSAVVAFGNESWAALDSIGMMRTTTDGPNVWRALLTHDDRAREVFWLPHPASNGSLWEKSHKALLASLRKRPAVTSGSRP
jgi:uracil-DNA glycosylase